jgi:TonB family protein
MCGVSAVAHAAVVVAIVLLSAQAGPRLPPLVAYTVEITDPSALGGRLPPGAPARDLAGGAARQPAPQAHGEPAVTAKPPAPEPVAKAEPPPETPPEPPARVEPPPAVKPPEPKAPEVKLPEPKPEPKPVEAKPRPEPKPVEPKAEPKPEATKPEPAKPGTQKPEPHKPEAAATAEPRTPPAARPAPAPGHPAAEATQGGTTAGEVPARDAYSAAAERWRSRVAGAGGGLGGTEGGSGPIGIGGEDKGGGGELVGLEYLGYLQQVNNAVKARWTTAVTRPGLLASVIFEVAADGTVSNIRLEQSSGNPAYDGSALRAVQLASPLPAPPVRYLKQLGEVRVRFNSEERSGGEG